MSTHVVIGGGVAGQHHLRVLRTLGRSARLLDIAQPDFDSARRSALRSSKGEEIWHVCTPTQSHMDWVQTLIAEVPRPRIILEKPIGRPGESKAFMACADQADIVVQSQYSYARVVEFLIRLAREHSRKGPLTIKVAFNKNRTSSGRFTDGERNALGYEGFHQLAIGLRLVEALRSDASARIFANFAGLVIRRCDATGFDLVLEQADVRMELASVLDRDPRRAKVEIIDCTAEIYSLHFETNCWITESPRQLHNINFGKHEVLLEEDLMQTGISACLSAIERKDHAEIARNQKLALAIEAILDRASESALEFNSNI